MSSRQLNNRAAHMIAMVARSGMDAAVTIAARTPMLITQGLNPTAAKTVETRRMVQEKVDAVFSGVLGAQAAWASFMIKAAFGRVRNGDDISNAGVSYYS